MRAQTRTAVAAALTAAVASFGIAPTASANEILVEPAPAAADEQRLPDADGDGLPDEWETNGVVLRDGTEIPLPDWGADPHRPDLFLQLNWMEDGNGRSFAPSAAILQDLVDLFDAHGIALHIDAGDVSTNIPNYGKTFGGETLDYTQNYFEGQVPAARLLNDIDQLTAELSAVARSLEEALGGKVQANLYMSSKRKQAFKAHFDYHDVFAMHVMGEKTWMVFEGVADHPIKHPMFESWTQEQHEAAKGAPWREVRLRPGDLLYLPRGQYHYALADDGACVIVVLHDLNLAAGHADRIVMLHGGRIAADGSPREVLTRATIERVYAQPVLVLEHPTRGVPLVVSDDPRA